MRIELPTPIFKIHQLYDQFPSVVQESEIIDKEKCIVIIPHYDTVYKMGYTDDEELIHPKIELENGFDLKTLGSYKKKIWKFENEWRYRLHIAPNDSDAAQQSMVNFFHFFKNKTPPPITNYLVKISDDAFQKMVIRLGPKLELGDLEIVQSLVKAYNESATIEKSSLLSELR